MVYRIATALVILVVCTQCANGDLNSTEQTGPIVVENQGQICFNESENSLEAWGVFKPKGCFSSGCTRPLQQKIDIRVDTTQFTIHFETRFTLIDPLAAKGFQKGSYECSADCGGAGEIHFDLGDVERGSYAIWLGSRKLGQISFPPEVITGQDICFGEQW